MQEAIFHKVHIDLTQKEDETLVLPFPFGINELCYKIEHDPKYEKITLFLDARDGKEKLVQVTLGPSGIKEDNLNGGILKSEDFPVEKIKLICYREVEFSFSLWKKE